MNKIRINSKQIFENSEDSFSEEHECDIIFLEDGFKIIYDNGEIIYDGLKVFLKSDYTSLIIEQGVKNFSKMHTPHGIIEIEVSGEKINYIYEPFNFEVKYFVKMGETKPYINELQVLVLN